MTTYACACAGFLFAVAAAIGTPTVAQAQLRQQAEAKLREMTPQEIDAALREYGISREEAMKKAQTLGISLQEYVTGARPKTAKSTPATLGVDPRLNWQTLSPVQIMADSLARTKPPESVPAPLQVPGFKGRRGIEGPVEPFGYAMFRYSVSTFLPAVTVATPPSYVLGSGDEIIISTWGETQLDHRLEVNREGTVYVPEVGPVPAQGLSITQFRERLLRRMASVYSGLGGGPGRARTFLDVSLGKLKTIQVFVLGEVRTPGGYAVSSMSGILHALYLAGGPTVDGTLRNIQILRKGEPVHVSDLYAFILGGDRTDDVTLQDGDIVFVAPATKRAAIVGEVLRPAIYELRHGESLRELIAHAGGLRFEAYTERVHVERIVPFEQRNTYDRDIMDIDVAFSRVQDLLDSHTPLENGDIVTVYAISRLRENQVSIWGNVNKPGPFEFRAGMRVADLIHEADSLRLSTFAERATLYRSLKNLRKEMIGFNARLALEGDERHNILLQNEDSIVVYSDSQFFPRQLVSVNGAVRKPGFYPRHERMTVADLVVTAGGLVEGSTRTGWELSRLDTSDVGTYTTLIKVDGDREYWRNDGGKGILLEDFDALTVPYDPRFSTQKFVTVTGYVMYPGLYSIRFEGERVADIFKRAGGLRPGAYLEGSRLIRKFNDAGLVPLDFRQVFKDVTSRDNVVVYDGDSINVAYAEDVIYVNGEVYFPSSVLYKEGAGLSYYIDQAGGYKEEAEKSNTVVFLPGGKLWESGDILPGSTIMVPRELDKPDTLLPIIRDLATILASLAAITVALIQVSK